MVNSVGPAAKAMGVKRRPSYSRTATLRLIDGEFELERVSIRLDGLTNYCVLCALLMGTALGLLTAIQFEEYPDIGRMLAKKLFILTATVSVVGGSYATVVFSLLDLYCKTAVGMSKDDEFLEFFAATAGVRYTAWKAFMVALMSLTASIVSCIPLVDGGSYFAWVITVSAGVATVLSWRHFNDIITLAGRLIFASK